MAAKTFIGESIEGASLGRRIRDLLLGDATSNFVVALAILIGFFHGWLKFKFRHPLVTFAFDIPLILALVITFSRMRSFSDFIPVCPTGRVMRIFYAIAGLCFLLALVLPWGAPPIVALAAVRGWLFSTLMFGLGYHLVVSRGQLHAYFLLVIVLAAITAVYATRQTLEEVEAMARLDPYFEMRLRGVRDIDDEGNLVLRRFSTFISSGAFGGTMSVALVFLAALVTDPRVPLWERLLLLALGGVIGWGMVLSGSRTSLISLGLGMLYILWFRRLRLDLAFLVLACAGGFYLASRTDGGGVTDRFFRLDLGNLWGRFYIVWAPGFEFLLRSGFIGGGLGKSAVGLPAFLFPLMWTFEVWGVDGDLGKVMAEMGVLGAIVITWLLGAAFLDVSRIALRHRQDSIGTTAMGAGACFIGLILTFPTGSPFLGIPLGVLSWFFLGAVVRLDHRDAEAAAASPAAGAGASAAAASAAAAAASASDGSRSGRASRETPGSLTTNRTGTNPRAGRERLYLHYRKANSTGTRFGAFAPLPPPRPPAPTPPPRPSNTSAAPTPMREAPAPSRPEKKYLYRPDDPAPRGRRSPRRPTPPRGPS